MADQHPERTIAGPCGFFLFCAGLLVPISVVWLLKDYPWIIIGMVAAGQLGALICGLIGWRDNTGKVAAVGGGLLLLLLVAFVVLILYTDASIRPGGRP